MDDDEDLELERLKNRIYGVELNELTHDVIGAAIEVHRALGAGFAESVYEKALCHELELRRIPLAKQRVFNLTYKGKFVGEGRLDLLVADQLIVELKSVDAFAQIHTVQVFS